MALFHQLQIRTILQDPCQLVCPVYSYSSSNKRKLMQNDMIVLKKSELRTFYLHFDEDFGAGSARPG